MFLSFVQKQNPALIDLAGSLIKDGTIEPDSYIIDLDAVEENAERLSKIAKKSNISLYFMSKQIGRNPEVARRVMKYGFKGVVAVDTREALSLHNENIPISHVGHLVQIPNKLIGPILKSGVEVITVYSYEKAKAISEKAVELGIVQDLLLSITGEDDVIYPGQEGGVLIDELVEVASKISELKGVKIAGVTTFPCFLFDEDKKKALPTNNAYTIVKAAKILLSELGIKCQQINMPSSSSLGTIPLISELGGTHGEPGHSLTGTNPDNLYEEYPLKPGIVYATEVSHQANENSLCFGGGYYRRSRVANAMVFTSDGYKKASVQTLNCESIDYHLTLDGKYPVGSPVVMAFRAQVFVTRSHVVLIEGLSKGEPTVVGRWDSQGNKIAKEGLI